MRDPLEFLKAEMKTAEKLAKRYQASSPLRAIYSEKAEKFRVTIARLAFATPTAERKALVEVLRALCDPSAESMPDTARLTAFVKAGRDAIVMLDTL